MDNGRDEEHKRLKERQVRFQDQLDQIGGELRAFMKSQVLMGENLDKMATHIEKIDIRLAEVTDKLNALIDIVDNHIHDDKRHN